MIQDIMQPVRRADRQPEMMTVSQLKKTGILPERAIRRIVAEGRVPVVKSGNRNYVNFDAFKRYLETGRVDALH